MARGGISHIALTARDFDLSTRFYDRVLGFMGFERVEVPETTQQSMKTRLRAWASPNGSITLRPANAASADKAHDRTAPGLNHLAFNADSRADVDRLHELLQRIGAKVLDAPAQYPISLFPGVLRGLFRRSRRRKNRIRVLADGVDSALRK